MNQLLNLTRSLLFAGMLTLIAGCASVDFDYPKDESTAIEASTDTYLDRVLSDLTKQKPGQSGFNLLTDGIDALAARLLIATRVERTLDVQYYLITNDPIGIAFIGGLLQAADRGVRVRLLLDDIQTQGYDTGMAALDSHPNFEVRIFNPFASRGMRASNFADFSRINRRMHNKSFTGDNRITIVGGRNIAAEYFSAREDVNFDDIDVVGIGPVVTDVSNMFDSYWNHRSALPVAAFAKMPDDPAAALVELRARIEENRNQLKNTPYVEAFDDSVGSLKSLGLDDYYFAPYELVYDSPDKSDKKLAADAASIATPLKKSIDSANSELYVVSPYFVPLKSGIEYLTGLQARGVQVRIITNSLASNNHSIVHSGYVPSRKPLLAAGVELYEVRPDAAIEGVERGSPGASLATLHTKGFLIDREEAFFGSFNWDPRSIFINTELGVIMKSPELSRRVAEVLDSQLDSHTYKVVLNEKGKIRWLDRAGEEEVVLDKEPQTSWWRRFTVGFYRILPIKGQL